jgi:hypothetical protein
MNWTEVIYGSGHRFIAAQHRCNSRSSWSFDTIASYPNTELQSSGRWHMVFQFLGPIPANDGILVDPWCWSLWKLGDTRIAQAA